MFPSCSPSWLMASLLDISIVHRLAYFGLDFVPGRATLAQLEWQVPQEIPIVRHGWIRIAVLFCLCKTICVDPIGPNPSQQSGIMYRTIHSVFCASNGTPCLFAMKIVSEYRCRLLKSNKLQIRFLRKLCMGLVGTFACGCA